MSQHPLSIRNFKDEDLETLCEIDRLCFPEGIAFSRADFLSHLNHPKSITWVGEGSGRILGFVMAQIDIHSLAHVITLDVIPEARNCGIATTLMTTLHAELQRKRIRAAILEVSTHNLPAQRLYGKLKYTYLETLVGYYQDREDAYRLVRIFK